MSILVTGGAGFIGSAMVRFLIRETDHQVINLDALTYAASLENLTSVASNDRYFFEHADIRDSRALDEIFRRHQPSAVIHLAAETHVDRSIDGPETFIDTNVTGTFRLLKAAQIYRDGLHDDQDFRFLHVSTDEVFGSLGPTGFFVEDTPYRPNSPNAASKAAADHIVRAMAGTYGLPAMICNCSNNYGPHQFPEKMIPMMILSALAGRDLPVYGDGGNVRDWLFVEDHVRALWTIVQNGRPGESYNLGGDEQHKNIDLVRDICGFLDELHPRADGRPHAERITFVEDRPNHDARYAIDHRKITAELDWRPTVGIVEGLCETITWYLNNRRWWEPLIEDRNGLQRRGTATS